MTSPSPLDNNNVFDLQSFRTKKQGIPVLPQQDISTNMFSPDLQDRISKVKESIQRINQLMDDLRKMSEKPKS